MQRSPHPLRPGSSSSFWFMQLPRPRLQAADIICAMPSADVPPWSADIRTRSRRSRRSQPSSPAPWKIITSSRDCLLLEIQPLKNSPKFHKYFTRILNNHLNFLEYPLTNQAHFSREFSTLLFLYWDNWAFFRQVIIFKVVDFLHFKYSCRLLPAHAGTQAL